MRTYKEDKLPDEQDDQLPIEKIDVHGENREEGPDLVSRVSRTNPSASRRSFRIAARTVEGSADVRC